MTITEDIFRAYDIRGVVENALTPDAVQLIGQAFATQALSQGQNTVVIGRDGRLSSPELAKRLSSAVIVWHKSVPPDNGATYRK